MFGFQYFKYSDRKRLTEINDLLAKTNSNEIRNKLLSEREQIFANAKNLYDCNVEECEDLKAQIYDKYSKVMNLGKPDVALQFQRMLESIDSRIQDIHISEYKKKQEEDEKSSKEADQEKSNDTSKRKVSSRTSTSKWSIDLSGLD